MKKYIGLSFALIFSISAFTQIKHNKFATRIKFDQFNSFDFWETGVSEIQDNSGYFLSNRRDNSGFFQPSLVKLDVDGNIIFDTIYDLTPNNLGGFVNFQNAITKTEKHIMLYTTGYLQNQMSLAAPYVINVDTAGTINWQVGIYHDTLDLEAQKIIPTQDGGYLVCGTL